MSDEAEAATEIAKTTGKAIDASRELGGFVARFVKGPLEQLAGIVEDRLKLIRWERQLRLIDQAEALMQERGLVDPTRAVPLKVMLPLLQAASMEDDDELQDRWAALLVNAGDADSGAEVQRMYVSILKDLGPLEVLLMDKIYELPGDTGEESIATWELPARAVVVSSKDTQARKLRDDIALGLENLVRLGCLDSAMMWKGRGTPSFVFTTALGRGLYAACSRRRP